MADIQTQPCLSCIFFVIHLKQQPNVLVKNSRRLWATPFLCCAGCFFSPSERIWYWLNRGLCLTVACFKVGVQRRFLSYMYELHVFGFGFSLFWIFFNHGVIAFKRNSSRGGVRKGKEVRSTTWENWNCGLIPIHIMHIQNTVGSHSQTLMVGSVITKIAR